MEWAGAHARGGELAVKVGDEWRLFTLKVVEYKTTTPKRWNVTWFEQIEKLLEKPDYAVIMTGPFSPRRVVKYRDVYHPSREV
jgi:hypothetical protein